MKKKHRIKKLERDVAELFRRFTALNGRVMDLECRIDECAPRFPPVDKDMLQVGLKKGLEERYALLNEMQRAFVGPQDRKFYG